MGQPVNLLPPVLGDKESSWSIPKAARQTLLESILFPNHTCSHPHAACSENVPYCASPRDPYLLDLLLEMGLWECLQGRASCSSHEAALSPPPPGFIFNSCFFWSVPQSQRAQANVGVSAECQPTASCAGHLHSGIIPLYSISELYFSGYFLRMPAQLYLGSLIPYSGHCSLPRCRI